jgi:hypothetical protein
MQETTLAAGDVRLVTKVTSTVTVTVTVFHQYQDQVPVMLFPHWWHVIVWQRIKLIIDQRSRTVSESAIELELRM